MVGRKSWIKPTTMENSLYNRLMGFAVRPILTSMVLITPFFPRITIQLKERITGLVNMGNTARAMSTPLFLEYLEI